jgi:hypothetical protein
MTDDRPLERAARSWLEEGPTRAPDLPVNEALARIQTTRQERDLGVLWRLPAMNPFVRLAGAALLVALAIGVGALASRPRSDVGPPSSTATPAPSPVATPPAPTGATLEAYRAERDAICSGFADASPIPEVPDWSADPAGAAEFVRSAIARGNAAIEALARLQPPSSIAAEHLANVQTGRDTLAVLEHERELLLAGKVSDALAVDTATGPLSESFQAFEAKYQLAACP